MDARGRSRRFDAGRWHWGSSSRCAQEPSTDRFSCVDEAYFEIPWNGRRTVVGHYDLASLETKTLEISDLNGLTWRLFAVAESLANAPQVIPPSVRGAGKVRHLAVIRGSPSSGRGHLLAISRAHGNFGSLFVIVWKDVDGTINLHSLKPLGAPPDGYLASSEDLRIVWKNRVPRPWMSPLTTSKLSIENEECLSLPGVDTYRVAESEGDGSASYIIAVNQNGDGVIFVLSASFRAYGWDWWQTDSVTNARCLGGSTLELEVEPKNMRWMTGRDFRTDPECPFTLDLAASRNAVMRIVEKPHVDGCKPRSPVVVITEPGRGISIKPWQEFLDSMTAEQDKVDPGLIHRR